MIKYVTTENSYTLRILMKNRQRFEGEEVLYYQPSAVYDLDLYPHLVLSYPFIYQCNTQWHKKYEQEKNKSKRPHRSPEKHQL